MDKDHNLPTIRMLNSLIETCHDGERGLREAAEQMREPHVRHYLAQLADERGSFAAGIATHVLALGGDPARGGSVEGAVRLAWTSLKSAIGGADAHLLSFAEKGEDLALRDYEAALAAELPATCRELVYEQLTRIRVAHDRVKSLRDGGK